MRRQPHIRLTDEEIERIDKIREKYACAISLTAVIRRGIASLLEREGA